MTPPAQYDGRAFTPAGSDGSTVGHYRQDGATVWAEFGGGPVVLGRLVGTCDVDGVIDAVYCQVLTDGRKIAGRCASTPSTLPDGRLRLTEHWQRIDGTTGVSVIEEVVPSTDIRPHLLLVGSGAQHFREYLLRSIAGRYRVHLLTSVEPTWEREHLAGHTVISSTLDRDVLVAAAAALHRDDPFDGVLCWDEARILATAEVAAALGLPGSPPDAVLRCRDKHLTRETLSAAGVAQPASVLVADVVEALRVADEIGYPVVLKPRALAASLGVVLVHHASELEALFAFARDTTVPEAPSYDLSVLVEEYADGPEISVDCAVFHGRVTPICLARKRIGYAPYFEEVGHEVRGDDPLLGDPELVGVLQRAHEALGFTDGMTHTELRLTSDGAKLIEVNARIGGDLIPYLGHRATGVDPGLAAADIACGREPALEPSLSLCGVVAFSYVAEETAIETIGFETDALPDDVDLAVVLAEPGHTYAPPPAGTVWGRVAYVTAVGESVDECSDVVGSAQAALRITPSSVGGAAA
jgi:glutathione synthase/RimK-type ligase-like ATP-grasp enzyme